MGFLDALSRVLGHRHEDHSADYDRSQWRKKMARVLDELPESQPEWDAVVADARSLNIEPDWARAAMRQEFAFLVRRAVADRRVTGLEHRKLDLARDLIGLSDADAEMILNEVVSEAEQLFGKPVREA